MPTVTTWYDETRTVETDFDGSISTRPYTAEENAQADLREQVNLYRGNASNLDAKVEAALALNTTIIGATTTYLTIADTATAGQVRDQVKALTQAIRALAKHQNGIIRLLTGRLDDISDTD